MWKISKGLPGLCLLAGVIFLGQTHLMGQSSGRITGTVIEYGTKSALPGANVVVQNTELGGSTDNQGQFIIGNIPAGTYTVNVFFMGYETASEEVVVAAGETEKVDFAMRSTVIQSDEVVVTAERLAQSQSTALNTQFNSNTIKNVIASDLMGRFPDNQAVEAMARIPGVSLTRDQGEGDMAIVRGLPPAWSSTTLNGEKVPSANGEGGRSVRLVNFPSDLIQTIEVSKALTADMDGDAIGGQVNLVTKDAPNRRLFTMSVRGGLTSAEAVHMGNYNFFGPRMVNLNIGDNLMDGKFGYLISGSYENNTASTINRTYEYDWDEYGPGKTELYDRQGNMLEDGLNYTKKKQYEINRRRAGVNASLVFKPVLGQKFYVRSFYNDRQYDQWKWSLKNKYYKSLAERETDGSRIPKSTTNVTAGGEHVLGNNAKIDYHATFAQSHGYSHQLIRASFAQDFSDLSAPYTFNDNENRPREYKENDNVGAANFKQPFVLGATHGTLQFGAKIRTKNRLQERYKYVSASHSFLTPRFKPW
ncbi:MAG: carboxypeptidase-like regulatory domain-containing protein [Calditrichota bacterium]